MQRLLVLGLLLVAGLAGCLADDNGDADSSGAGDCPVGAYDDADIQILATTDDPIHDERGEAWDFSTYNKRTCSLPAIGHTTLRDGDAHGYIGEIDMRGDLNLGAVAVLGNGETPMVYVLDITDRAAPVVLSVIEQDGTYVTDVKFSDDGAILYTASQNVPGPGELFGVPELAGPTGFTAYDVSDPAAPLWLGYIPDTQVGCHMLDPVQVAPTQDAVWCISQQARAYLVERGNGVLVNLGFVDYIPNAGPAGLPAPSGVPAVGGVAGVTSSGPHDMTAYHEGGAFGNGRSYQMVSHWDSGLRVVEFTDAPLATEVGTWNGEGATHYDGNVHTAMAFDTTDGRYIIASPEYTSDGTVPSLWVLKADDFGALELVGEWFHPGEHDSQGLFLTTHQWQVAPTGADVNASDIRIYLTYNHAGIWVLDLGQILAGDNEAAILGYNLARTPLAEEDNVGNAILSTWDVNVVDGYIYGSDRATGLWVFHYDGDELGDERLRGFA